MTFLNKLPGSVLIFLGALCLSFGGIIVKSFEGATLWQILFWRSIFFSITVLVFLLITYKKKIFPPTCIKDRGLKGKWQDNNKGKRGIGPLKKGTLGQFGYHKVKDLNFKARRSALKKCIKKIGKNSCWRKLNAIWVYNRNTNPSTAKIFKEDRDWVKTQ